MAWVYVIQNAEGRFYIGMSGFDPADSTAASEAGKVSAGGPDSRMDFTGFGVVFRSDGWIYG